MRRVSVVLIALIAAAAMIVATRAQVGDPPPPEDQADAVVGEYMAAARRVSDATDCDTGLALNGEILTRYPDRPEPGRTVGGVGPTRQETVGNEVGIASRDRRGPKHSGAVVCQEVLE